MRLNLYGDNMLKVSIIIPVYNVASYIEDCLNSVLSQTYPNIECIIVDDCGQDDSMCIVKSILTAKSSRLEVRIVTHEVNKGLSEARNSGIREATGDYLYFLDSDDYIAEDAIERMVTMLEKHAVDFVVGDIATFGEDSEQKDYLRMESGYLFGNKKISHSYSESLWYMMAWNKMVSRSFLLKNEVFFAPNIYHEDELWSFKLALVANSMAVCNRVTYFYRIRKNGSIMSNLTMKHVEDMLFIFDTCLSLSEKYHRACIYSKLRTFYLTLICNGYRLNDKAYASELLQCLGRKHKRFFYRINLLSCSWKNKVKYVLCLMPIRILYAVARILPF